MNRKFEVHDDERIRSLPVEQVEPVWTHTTKHEIIGLIVIALASLAVSCANVLAKVSYDYYPPSQLLFVRYIFQGILSLFGCYKLGIHPFAHGHARKWVLIRGFFGAFSSIFIYYSLQYLPLADAIVIEKIHPVFAVIFAAILLNEPFGWFERISATFCFTGVVLASKPSFLRNAIEKLGSVHLFVEYEDQTHTFGLICAVLAPIVSAVAYVSIRKAGPDAHYLNHMFSLSVTSVIINAVDFQNYVWRQEFYPYLILFGVVFVSFISQGLFNRGLQLAPSGPGTLMCMNEIVFAFIFGMLVFGDYPDYLSILGAVVIVVSCSAIAWKKWKFST